MLSSIERALVGSRRFVVTYTPQSTFSVISCTCHNYSSKPNNNSWKVYQPPKARKSRAYLAQKQIELDAKRKSKIKPVLEAWQRKKLQATELNEQSFKTEFGKEIRQYGDVYDEPGADVFDKTFKDYMKDEEEMKEKLKKRKFTKKHYGGLNPFKKEMSLLTWAEKESIRYLHSYDPETWTPEAISEAFPISPEGVVKLVKGSLRLRRVKDVIDHDQQIAQRMEDIKTGKIELTEDLEKRLKIRELCGPLKIGDLGMHPDSYVDTSLPEKLGEFASLVAPRETPVKSKETKKSVVIADGDVLNPESELETFLKPEMDRIELGKILPLKKQMTFSQFEDRMLETNAEKKAGDMKYMLEDLHHIEDRVPRPSSTEIELPLETPAIIQKYNELTQSDKVEVNVEGEEGYMFQKDTGYEKPYTSSSSELSEPPMKIEIPSELKGNPGATYKVGNCYYDENGEFLYRVI